MAKVKSIAFIGSVRFAAACCWTLHHAGLTLGQIVSWPMDESVAGWEGMPHVSTLSRNITTKDANSPKVIEAVSRCDLLVCGGWSRIFGAGLLRACPLGAVNLHPTLLPEGRGRAPIPWTIIKGLKRSGVTLHYMTEGCDDGDIIAQEEYPIDPDETAETLYFKATEAAQRLCREYVPRLLEGSAPRTPQDHAKATVWGKRTPKDSEVDRNFSSDDIIWAQVRALDKHYPRAYFLLNTSHGLRKVYLSTQERTY